MNRPLISFKWGLTLFIFFYLSTLHAQIDLSIINPNSAVTSIPAGKLEVIGCQLHNSGSSPSPSQNWVHYYLSRDAVLDTSDLDLGFKSAGYVAANWSINVNHNISIPLSTDTGSYYILFIADKHNFITETDETNNTNLLPITITAARPDFRALNGDVNPRIVVPNTTTTVSYTIVNDGIPSDSIEVGFYLSTDHLLSANDLFIGHTKVDSLIQGGILHDTATVTIPAGTFPNRYSLLVHVDYLNSQPELYETNNLTSDLLFVQLALPDLSIRQIRLGADTVIAGYSVSVYNYLDNNGGSSNSSSRTAHYLSIDTLLDTSDVFLQDAFVSSMYANASTSTNTNVAIPGGTAPGNYYIISETDYQEAVPESNEVNNTAFAPLTILPIVPDLMVATLSINTFSGMPNTSININNRLRNIGIMASPTAEVKYYLSTQSSYDSTAILIDSTMVPALNSFQDHTYNFSYTLPANLTLGAYYIIAYIDPSNTIAEFSETNNTRFRGLTVVGTGPPDLAIGTLQANATTAMPNGEVEFNIELQNLGQNTAGGQQLGYYWSTDTLYDNTDTYLGYDFISGIVPNGALTITENLRIPSVSVYGTYYILFFADHQAALTEADETNNIAYFPLVVDTLYKPDLTITAYQASPDTIQVGSSISLSATVQNTSTSTVSSSRLRYALSTDTILDNGDYSLRTSHIASMGAFQTRSDSYTPVVPFSVPAGEYYVLFYTDPLYSITETNENNNGAYQSTKVVILGNSSFQPDLAIPNSSINKDTVEVGDWVTVTAELHNNTSRTATYHRVSYYWSVDSLWDSTDVYLASRSINLLTSSYPRTEVQNLTIPIGAALGNYHILVVTDDLQQIAESDENNNIAAVPVVIAAPRPELTISSMVSTPSTLEAGTATTVYYNVRNTGINTGVGGHYTGYYLSSDNVFDASDTYLGEGYIDTVTINGSTGDTALLVIPPTTPLGNYYLIFYADHRQQQREQDETNNTRARAITIQPANPNPYADFVVQSPAVNTTSIAPSFTTGVSCTVRNRGNGNSYNYARLGYYLSPTPYYNSGMIELWYSSIGTLTANTSTAVATNVMIPPGTPAGDYYILFFADNHRAEPENNENNNIAFRSITVTGTPNTQTDLIVDNPSINIAIPSLGLPTVPAGNTVNLRSTIKNLGNSTRTSFVGYYLSTDQTYSTNDLSLGSEFVDSLMANGSSLETSTITIPGTISAGTYYILFKADDQGQISERVENNNIVAVPFRVTSSLPDLLPQNASISTTLATAGDFVGVNCRVSNIGAGASNGTNLGYYLSTVPRDTSTAIFLGAEYIPNLAINASVQKNYIVPIPGTTPSGTYYLLFYVDHQALELESNDTNNIISQTITIIGNPSFQPDVVVEHPSIATNSLVVGSSTTVDCSIRNQGGVTANSTVTGYYLSVDTLLDPTDVLVGSNLTSPINNNDSLLQTTMISIPINTLTGNYYVLYVADHLNALIESNDTNNIAYLPLTITASQADLVVKQTMATPTAVFSGNTINVSSWVHNQGSMAIANTGLGYYLSTDTLYDNGDVYLNVSPVDTLQAGDSSLQQLALTIPIATTTGNYYLLYYADHQVTRAEIDKTNNIAYVPLAITEPQPDLRIQQVALTTDTITVGTTVGLSAFLKNAGIAASGSSTIGYYLSTDSIYSTNDLLLTTENNSGLGIGDSVALNKNITLPNSTTAGNYYILWYADHQNTVAENDETNNVQAMAVTVILPLPDLFLSNAVVAPTTITPGDALNVSCVINNSSIQGVGNHRLGYYLATTPWATNAIPLGDTLITGIAGNGNLSQSMNITIPAGTSAGNYFIRFYIDDQLAIAESNESNNRVSLLITISPPSLPDATVQGATVNPSSIVAGGTTTLSSTVQNIGTSILAASTLSYYLSPTPTYDSSTAVLLGNTPVGNISVSSFMNRINNVVIPASTAIGNYYILFYADANNTSTESDESNNITAVAITITEPLSDLTVQNSSAVYVNGQLHLSALVANIGMRASGATTLGYFFSTDPFYDSGDVLLGTDTVAALAPSTNRLEDGVWSLPAGATSGLYYVLFVADYLQVETEELENNNIRAKDVDLSINVHQLPTTQLLIYPSPTLQQVAIEMGSVYQDVQVQVYNPLGQLIQTTAPKTTAKLVLDLEGPAGIYLLQITTKEGTFKGIPIVKE